MQGWCFGLRWESPHDPGEVSFSRYILPILSDHCFQCHGPDPAHRKGGLRLICVRKSWVMVPAIRLSSPVISEQSALQRIRSVDPDEVMPPEKAHKPLSEDQKQLLERWVSQGAAGKTLGLHGSQASGYPKICIASGTFYSEKVGSRG